MSTTAVGQCPQCLAVVNVHWPSCLVCHARLIAGPVCEQAAPTAITTPTPIPPLAPGWSVVYRDQDDRLRGGCDEPDYGIVTACTWNGATWTVTVRNGAQVPLGCITSVRDGNTAWTVREHGYDGEGTR